VVEGERNNKEQVYLQRVRDLYPGLEAGTTRLIDEGEFNDILIVDNTLIFRFPRSPDGIERLRIEVALLEAIQEHVSLPIPNPSFISEDMETVGMAFMGYRMLSGEPLRDHLNAFKAEAACRHLAGQLATFLRELHDFPVEAVGLELPVQDRGRREALPGTYEHVRQHLYPHMRLDARDLIAEQFGAFLEDPSSLYYERAIKHGDLGPGNILLDPETLSGSGILDFGSAGLDDPAVDLGLVSFWGESLLGSKSFVEQLYDTYPVVEPLLRRVRFYKVMIPLWVALGALQSNDREAFKVALAPYV
jgi:aminoglycoside 2''-phosphotransferase